jgi:hypothetical protein
MEKVGSFSIFSFSLLTIDLRESLISETFLGQMKASTCTKLFRPNEDKNPYTFLVWCLSCDWFHDVFLQKLNFSSI